MRTRSRACGFAAVELAVVLVALAILLSIALPVIAGGRGDAGLEQSMSNLTTLGLAHIVYAADWNGRQVTWARDDLGVYYGSIDLYNEAHGCDSPIGPDCQPPLIAGWGESLDGVWGVWGYWSGPDWTVWPISFLSILIKFASALFTELNTDRGW